MAGGVAADEALHELVGVDVEGVAGDVLDRDDHQLSPAEGRDIDPGARQRILHHVAKEVIQHPPQEPAVGHHRESRLQGGDRLQFFGLQSPAVLLHRLAHQLRHTGGCKGHLHVAGGRFGRLHQILRELLEALGLPVEHLQVVRLLFTGVRLLQKIHIVHNGGEGRLDIVGDVGDELCFQPLGLHALLHSLVHAFCNGIEVVAMALEVPVELLGVQLVAEVSRRQLASGVPQRQHLPRTDDHQEENGQVIA